jgi:hypothetical protein
VEQRHRDNGFIASRRHARHPALDLLARKLTMDGGRGLDVAKQLTLVVLRGWTLAFIEQRGVVRRP